MKKKNSPRPAVNSPLSTLHSSLLSTVNSPLSTASFPLSAIGQLERKTQKRVVRLFSDKKYPGCLGYDYLGDWTDRDGNRNVEEGLLRKFLREKQSYDEALITRALHDFTRAADDTSKSLYDRN